MGKNEEFIARGKLCDLGKMWEITEMTLLAFFITENERLKSAQKVSLPY